MAANAVAQTHYPAKPIRILVGLAAGGPADTVARLVGDELSRGLGTPVLIENVTGAGGNLATDRVAKAAPDGYTLLLATSGPIIANPILYKRVGGRHRGQDEDQETCRVGRPEEGRRDCGPQCLGTAALVEAFRMAETPAQFV